MRYKSILVLSAAALAAGVLTPTAFGARGLSAAVEHVRADGIDFGYRLAGPPNAPPLLLIMGFSGTMAEWDPALVDRLARSRRVIAFDNRGMGTSSWRPGARLTISLMADDAWRLVRALGLEQVDVLGWSMGGNIAQQLAIRHPDVVRRLVLAATDPGSPHAVQPTNPAVLELLEGSSISLTELTSLIFPDTAAGKTASESYVRRVGSQPGIRGSWFASPPHVVAAQAQAEGPRWLAPGRGAYGALPRIDAPTLVLDGALDLLEPPENSRIIVRRIPGARLHIFPGAGHAFLFQYHDRVAAMVRGFLE